MQPLTNRLAIHLRRQFGRIEAVHNHRLAALKSFSGHGPLNGNQAAFGENSATIRIVERMDAQVTALGDNEHDCGCITTHYAANTPRGGTQHVGELQVRHDLVRELKNELELLLHALRNEKIDWGVDR